MEKMILQINGSIFSGTTDGKYFYFNMIDRAEMGDKVQLVEPEPIKASVSLWKKASEVRAKAKQMADKEIKDRLEELRKAIENENISYGEIAELQGLAEYIDPDDVQLLEWAGVEEFGKQREEMYKRKNKEANASKKDVKADEVVDTFVMDEPTATDAPIGDAVIEEPVAEEIKEIVEEKTDVELLKDVKEDIAKAEQGVEEMIKREEGEAVEEIKEIEPIVGPIEEPTGETVLPEPMVAGAKKEKPARKFVVDPTEVGKKDMVKK